MKKLFLFIIFCCSLFEFSGQNFDENLQKYWKYRERLKNFVIPGDCQGCGYPAQNIEWGNVGYPDETIELGHYIMFLATENYLLNHYLKPDADNRKDLFYAMEAFNRLDRTAEYWWDNMGFNTTNYVPDPTGADLNGFFIRDDNRWHFLDDIYDGKMNETRLWDHYAPLADGKRKIRTANSFNERDWYSRSGDYTHGGPTEVSLDQIIGMTEGLAFVTRFLDPAADFPAHVFSDGETNFVAEAKKISARISGYVLSHNFLLKNPVTGQCVKATDWKTNNCADGGAIFSDLSYGYALAESNIQSNFNAGAAQVYFQNHYGSSSANSGGVQSLWSGQYKNHHHFLLKEEDKILTLAATGNVWGLQTTNQILSDRSVVKYDDYNINFPHMPLMHSVIYNTPTNFPISVYECMLNNAPPEGQNAYDHNWEWSNNRITYGPNSGGLFYADEELKGVDYLAYFNLYCIYTIQHGSAYSATYDKISPLQLCSEDDLVKSGQNGTTYKEWDFKRFAAVNSITAGNINNAGDYWIRKYDGDAAGVLAGNSTAQICKATDYSNYRDNRDNASVPCDYDALEATDETFVEFLAGAEINLKPGFTVSNGGEMHAHLLPNALKKMDKGAINPLEQCSVCKTNGSEEITNNKTNNHKYKVVRFSPDKVFVISPHIIFKIRDEGYAGDNMFDIEQNGQVYFTVGDDGNYYLEGYHDFRDVLPGSIPVGTSEIVDVDYIGGYLFVCLENGTVYKILGLGGTDHGMFGNQLTTSIVGWYQFNNGDIQSLEVSGGDILVSINMHTIVGGIKSKIIKFNGMGGIGNNFWGMTTDTHSSAIGGSVSGFQLFEGKITQVKNVKGDLYVCTLNGAQNHGKILKVSGTGGHGSNMFNISEPSINSNFAFVDNSPNNSFPKYYIGDQKFKINNSYITALEALNNGDEIVIGIKNGKAIRLQNDVPGVSAPTGHYMFNLDINSNTFGLQSTGSHDYRLGFSDYTNNGNGWIFNSNDTYVSDFEFVDGYLMMGFHDGHVLKVDLSTYSNNSSTYAIGNQVGVSDFKSSVVSITTVNDRTFITFCDGLILCVNKSGGTGSNNFSVRYQNEHGNKNGWYPLCGYDYYIGSQDLDDVGAGARVAMDSIPDEGRQEEAMVDPINVEGDVITQCWPNPASNLLNIEAEAEQYPEMIVQITDISGKVFENLAIFTGKPYQFDLSAYAAGLYFVSFKTKDNLTLAQKKIIKQ